MPSNKGRIPKEKVVVHFAGDSGDGIQLTGFELTRASTVMGNDVRSCPDIPAEIRAPAGTVPGVSGFMLCFATNAVYTAGDQYDTLIAMNPAALMATKDKLKPDGCLIIDSEKFTDKDFKRARLDKNPIDELQVASIVQVPLSKLTIEAVAEVGLSNAKSRKCKNFLALGMVYWLYDRDLEPTLDWINLKFKHQPDLAKANSLALTAGYRLAQTGEYFMTQYHVPPGVKAPGLYRHVTGNLALALGATTASYLAKTPLFMAGYPITPASDILHHLAAMESIGIKTFQAEDEMGAVGAALGASYAGDLALTCTSGPGMDLKSETIGLAVMTELPLVVVDVMRAGPSTGMPTRSEQSDLMMARYGRHGECEVPILAPLTPGDCFEVIIEAFRLAVTYRTPVILLSDAYLANGAEPMKLPDIESFIPIHLNLEEDNVSPHQPYARDAQTLARHWAIPGMKGKMHRIGGLEKEMPSGNISNAPKVHEQMVKVRAQKVQNAHMAKPYERFGQSINKHRVSGMNNQVDNNTNEIREKFDKKVLVLGWGSTYGLIRTLIETPLSTLTTAQQSVLETCQLEGLSLRAIHPFPVDLGKILQGYDDVFVFENNTGQLCQLLRAKYLKNCQALTNLSGKPLSLNELVDKLCSMLSQSDVQLGGCR